MHWKTLRDRLTYANVASTIALVSILGGGTAMAVNGPLAGRDSVGSKDIIKGEVKSTDIADGKVTGVDIDESTLEKVPDADFFDGLDSASYVKGPDTTIVRRAEVHRADNFSSILVLSDPGISLGYTCPEDPVTQNGILYITNRSGEVATLFVDDGGANPIVMTLDPDENHGEGAARAGEHITFSLGAPGVFQSRVDAYTAHRGGTFPSCSVDVVVTALE